MSEDATTNLKRFVIVPSVKEENGPEPYGYHHVWGLYDEHCAWFIMTIDSDIDVATASSIVGALAGERPIEINQNFYRDGKFRR